MRGMLNMKGMYSVIMQCFKSTTNYPRPCYLIPIENIPSFNLLQHQPQV